jgi:predicted metalloprotease with PDZ domain
LAITADGKPIAWTRDLVNVFAFHVPLPSTATSINVDFQYLAPPVSEYGRTESTQRILTLDWDAVTLYPAGYYSRQIVVDARLRIPSGWQLATALERVAQPGDEVRFAPTTFETLVDSPVYAGEYTTRIDLDPGASVPVHMNLFADSPELLTATPDELSAHRHMVQQAYRLFGARHYDHYDFLVYLSDLLRPMGVEHHRSSFDGLPANYLTEWDKSVALHDLLSHEFVHSWNGKFRRPADLWTPNYNVPMRDSLLWVYEGQTQYWGTVAALKRVQPYDWATFLHQRIAVVNVEAPTAGLTRGGYRLVFNDTPSDLYKAADEFDKVTSLTYSVGLSVDKDGDIKEVLWNGPAFQAGLAPGSRIIAVDDVAFDVDRFKTLIKAAEHESVPITLIVRQGERFRTVRLDYHGGLRYPHLERDPNRSDLLQAILAPKD